MPGCVGASACGGDGAAIAPRNMKMPARKQGERIIGPKVTIQRNETDDDETRDAQADLAIPRESTKTNRQCGNRKERVDDVNQSAKLLRLWIPTLPEARRSSKFQNPKEVPAERSLRSPRPFDPWPRFRPLPLLATRLWKRRWPDCLRKRHIAYGDECWQTTKTLPYAEADTSAPEMRIDPLPRLLSPLGCRQLIATDGPSNQDHCAHNAELRLWLPVLRQGYCVPLCAISRRREVSIDPE